MADFDAMRSIGQRVEVLRARYAQRDARMNMVRAVRAGDYSETLFGDLFPTDWPKPIVANMVDTVARDLAEVIAPLPTISCTGSGLDDGKRSKADKRTRIVNAYVSQSKLGQQMFTGADQYVTYGFLPLRVEPNTKTGSPHITVEDPLGAYPEFDRWGNVTAYYRRFSKTVDELVALFPEYADKIANRGTMQQPLSGSAMLEVIRWVDDEREMLFLPERKNLVLRSAPNPLGRCPVVVARRPGLDGELRGQFDDVLWIQLARAKFALLSMDAAQKSVEAPLAVPNDVTHLPIGGDSVIRSREPDKIRRVGIDMPQGAFAQSASLEQEMRIGARYPEGRSGNMDASVVTGRGVQALMGGFDTQVKTAQEILGDAISEAVAMCLEMDEVLWPDGEKKARGVENGAPYEVTYKPSRDIKGEYGVDVTYGMMAGLDPNRALVWLLQARGDKLVSRQYARKNLPVAMNTTDEERVIDIEEYRDALGQGVQGLAASLPAMAQAGQDPTAAIQQIAKIIQSRSKGKSVEDSVMEAFEPPEPVESAVEGGEPGAPNNLSGDPAQALGGAGSGLMPGVAPGQAALGAGGRPDLSQLMASLSASGKPNLSASIQRRRPI